MLKLKPFNSGAEVTFQKLSPNKIEIHVSADGVSKSVTASVFQKEAALEIEKVNLRPRNYDHNK